MRFSNALALFFLFALLLPISTAANESSLPSNASSEPPPGLPTSQGIVVVSAIYTNGSPLSREPILVLAKSNRSDTLFQLITSSSGSFVLPLEPGSFRLDSLLDFSSTPGVDFASTASIEVSEAQNATLIFYPAGSLAGKVTQNGSPVSGARVRVSCPSAAFDLERINGNSSVQAGEAGDFLFRAIPMGTCTVSSSTDSFASSEQVGILQGKITAVTIELVKKAPEQEEGNSLLMPLVALAFVALVLAALLYIRLKSDKESAQPSENKAQEPPPAAPQKPARKEAVKKTDDGAEMAARLSDPKVRAVLSTLSEREREIVRFIFRCNGRAKRSTIQNKLLIPKTSLLRNLRSLERKNILKLTPFGRNLLAEIQEKTFN